MTLRPATATDAAVIAAVEAAASAVPWTAAQVAASLGEARTGAWVLEDGGEVVGHLLVSAQGDEGEVLIVAMHPRWQRRGGGGALLDAAAAWWRERGVREAFLEVREGNEPARALYAGRGFVEVGRRRGYYRDGADALVMKRSV